VQEQHHTHEHPPVGGGAECLACPICVLLQAVSSVRPEVVQHLVAAGRELTLALQAVVAAQADAHAEHDEPRVERIRVD
jgi:hypothetical protein